MPNKKTQTILHSMFMLLLLWSCSTTPVSREIANAADIQKSIFPEITTDNGDLSKALTLALKKSAKGMDEAEFKAANDRLLHYMMYLGLTAKDFKKAEAATAVVTADNEVTTVDKPKKDVKEVEGGDDDDDDKTPSNLKAIQRLFISSTQFLECADLRDWECLEKEPKLKPRADFRTPKQTDLGSPVIAGDALDMDVFFTEAWDGSPSGHVVDRFAERLNSDVGKSLSIAMYGIDDINGSMKGVYDAIVNHANTASTTVRAVVDVSGFERGKSPWVFDYVKPDNTSTWLFGESTTNPGGMHATFQYDGTPNFIHAMNDGIKMQEESRVRLEWSTSHIMHNKYAVLENNDGIKSVWTGTANISNHCMGTEANSNMSIYIRNDSVAQAYLDEFNLMFKFDPSLPVKSKLVMNNDDKNPVQAGRFHRNKYPVSKRFFKFNDGTNLRVHFAPTDDAEHRVILPMLLSAKEGDEIRISMFGGTGYEIVRAMQFAVAKGANVRIVYDSKLGHGLTSWTRDSVLNVFMKNPYVGKIANPPAKIGSISVRISTWKGKNHYKVGTLTRKLSDGSMRAEQIILGSQNWSSGGNDQNDENLISIQNLQNDVKAAAMFNKEFDNRLWVKSRDERPRLMNAILN
jgi:phosphatidylserine/phosphatidylglycerophosphate/cardiolipin synthase-like enzyme